MHIVKRTRHGKPRDTQRGDAADGSGNSLQGIDSRHTHFPCFTRSKGLNGSIPISLVFNRVKQVPFPGVTVKTTEKHLGDCQINSHVLEWIHLPLTVDHPKGSLSRNQDAATGKQHAPRVGDYVSKCKS